MSRKARAQTKERRLRQKRARKAAMRAQYETWMTLGQNKKSKRARARSKGANRTSHARLLAEVPVLRHGVWVLAFRTVHGGPFCGNVGCKRCSGVWNHKKTEILLLSEVLG